MVWRPSTTKESDQVSFAKTITRDCLRNYFQQKDINMRTWTSAIGTPRVRLTIYSSMANSEVVCKIMRRSWKKPLDELTAFWSS